jgi:hypothetical protein
VPDQSQPPIQESSQPSSPSKEGSSPAQKTVQMPERLTTASLGKHMMELEIWLRQRGQWRDPEDTRGIIIVGTTQAEAHLKRYKEQQAKEAEAKGKP